MRHEIEKRTDAGTIMNALNVRNIPKLEFYLPPAKIRDSVETTLKTIQDARELLLKERQELAALRDALLPKLMFGEIDVSKVDLTQLNSHLAEPNQSLFSFRFTIMGSKRASSIIPRERKQE